MMKRYFHYVFMPLCLSVFALVLLLLALPASVSAAAPGDVLIIEVSADPASGAGIGEPGGEFIELFNTTGAAIDLNGWTLAENGSSFTFASSTILDPGQAIVIIRDASTLSDPAQYNCASVPYNAVWSGMSLSNSGDFVTLTDSSLVLVDGLSYGSNTTVLNPAAPDVFNNSGTTLQRAGYPSGPFADTDTNADWAGSASPGTPCDVAPPADALPAVTSTDPANGATNVPTTTNIVITFTEPVSVTASWLTITCDSGPVAVTLAPLMGQTTFSITPDTPLPAGETCTVTLDETQVTDSAGQNPAPYSFSFDTVAPPPSVMGVVINELDYDTPGTDSAEFVELYNSSGAPIDLSANSCELQLVNGSNDTIYDTIPLTGILNPNDFFVICGDSANVANCDIDDDPNTNFIQNGNPDAVALVCGGGIVDTVSYEGDVTGYTEGSGAQSDTDTQSLNRNPDGADTDDNSADFELCAITPGEPNQCTVPSTIIITELLPDSCDSNDDAEYAIACNVGPDVINMAGWGVGDAGTTMGTADTVFIDDTLDEAAGDCDDGIGAAGSCDIQPNECVILASSDTELQTDHWNPGWGIGTTPAPYNGYRVFEFGDELGGPDDHFDAHYNNAGDIFGLFNNLGQPVACVSYGDQNADFGGTCATIFNGGSGTGELPVPIMQSVDTSVANSGVGEDYAGYVYTQMGFVEGFIGVCELELDVEKAVEPNQVFPGDTVTYTISITNSTNITADVVNGGGATITDTFSTDLTVTTCTNLNTGDMYTVTGNQLAESGLVIPPNTVVEIQCAAVVSDQLNCGDIAISNSADMQYGFLDWSWVDDDLPTTTTDNDNVTSSVVWVFPDDSCSTAVTLNQVASKPNNHLAIILLLLTLGGLVVISTTFIRRNNIS